MERFSKEQDLNSFGKQQELRKDRQARAVRQARYGDIESIDSHIANLNMQEEANKVASVAWRKLNEHLNW